LHRYTLGPRRHKKQQQTEGKNAGGGSVKKDGGGFAKLAKAAIKAGATGVVPPWLQEALRGYYLPSDTQDPARPGDTRNFFQPGAAAAGAGAGMEMGTYAGEKNQKGGGKVWKAAGKAAKAMKRYKKAGGGGKKGPGKVTPHAHMSLKEEIALGMAMFWQKHDVDAYVRSTPPWPQQRWMEPEEGMYTYPHGEEPVAGAPPKTRRIKQPPRLPPPAEDNFLLWDVPPVEPRRVLDPRDLVPELTAGMRRLAISREQNPAAGDAPPPPPPGGLPVNVDEDVVADMGVNVDVVDVVDADVDVAEDVDADAEVERPPELFLTPSMAAEGPGAMGFAFSPARREGSESPSPPTPFTYTPLTPPPLTPPPSREGGVAGAPPTNEDDEEVEVTEGAEGGDIAGGRGLVLTRKRGRRRVGDRGRARGYQAATADFRVHEAMQSKVEEEHKRAWAAWWGCTYSSC
jgi:hypothetical protein